MGCVCECVCVPLWKLWGSVCAQRQVCPGMVLGVGAAVRSYSSVLLRSDKQGPALPSLLPAAVSFVSCLLFVVSSPFFLGYGNPTTTTTFLPPPPVPHRSCSLVAAVHRCLIVAGLSVTDANEAAGSGATVRPLEGGGKGGTS